MKCTAYFRARFEKGHPEHSLYARVGNALSRAGVQTMAQLCDMPESELKRIRNIGAKGLAIVLAERQRFQASTKETKTQ